MLIICFSVALILKSCMFSAGSISEEQKVGCFHYCIILSIGQFRKYQWKWSPLLLFYFALHMENKLFSQDVMACKQNHSCIGLSLVLVYIGLRGLKQYWKGIQSAMMRVIHLFQQHPLWTGGLFLPWIWTV